MHWKKRAYLAYLTSINMKGCYLVTKRGLINSDWFLKGPWPIL